MKLGKAIQEVQSLYSRGVQARSTRLTSRFIYSKLMTARSTLLVQKNNKNQLMNTWNMQTLPCIELITATPHECKCVPPAGCIVLRTKFPLPAPLSGMEGSSLITITSLDGKVKFDETDFDDSKYADGNKYTSKKPQYYIYNKYGFITISRYLKVITATGVFDDPVEAWLFESMCEEDCDDCCKDVMDMEFPLDNDTTRTAIDMTVDKLLIPFVQMRKDSNNDSSDDASSGGGMVHQANPQG